MSIPPLPGETTRNRAQAGFSRILSLKIRSVHVKHTLGVGLYEETRSITYAKVCVPYRRCVVLSMLSAVFRRVVIIGRVSARAAITSAAASRALPSPW